jgi:hypothetical protein
MLKSGDDRVGEVFTLVRLALSHAETDPAEHVIALCGRSFSAPAGETDGYLVKPVPVVSFWVERSRVVARADLLIVCDPDVIEPRCGYDFDVVLTGELAERVRGLLRSVRRDRRR